MVKIVSGDILTAQETYVAYLVNCWGTINDGLASRIRDKYPNVARRYGDYCNEHSVRNLLGRVLFIPTDDCKIICNVFGEEGYGYNKQLNFVALTRAFKSMDRIIPEYEKIAIPYAFGGDCSETGWEVVYQLIKDTFKKHDVFIYWKKL